MWGRTGEKGWGLKAVSHQTSKIESDSLLPWVILRIDWVDFSNAHNNAWHSENAQ